MLACTYEVVDVLRRALKQPFNILLCLCAWVYANVHISLRLRNEVFLLCVWKKYIPLQQHSHAQHEAAPYHFRIYVYMYVFHGGSVHSSLSSCIFLRPLSSFPLRCWPNLDEILDLTALLSSCSAQHAASILAFETIPLLAIYHCMLCRDWF